MPYDDDYARGVDLGRRIVQDAGGDPDLRAELIAVFADRVARVWLLRDRWEKAQRPTTTAGSKGQKVQHPLVLALEQAETALMAAERSLAPPSDGRIGARLPHLRADLTRPQRLRSAG